MARDDRCPDLRSTAQPRPAAPRSAARLAAHPAGRLALTCIALWLCGTTVAQGRSVELRVEQVDGKPVVGAVVMLRALDDARPAAPAIDAVMDQLDRRFVPDVLVVPVGSRVTFPNSDPISHQVYSFSPIRRFQLPLYRGEPYPPVDFPQAGIATLGCNIHDEMRAYIVVTDGRHYGRTSAEGLWRASDVRAGAYVLNVWHPRLRDPRGLIEQRVEITDEGDVQTLVVRAGAALRPASRVAKPASWDAY
ncbi:MAG: methylamine utilization protein [Steroidobacteraceae bacterium]